MKKQLSCILILVLVVGLTSCGKTSEKPKIGVSFGVGAAERWGKEKIYMEEHAKKLGAEIEVRLNTTDKPKTQIEDCKELVDSGIDVLVLTPRDVNNVDEILAYAQGKGVKVVGYARVALSKAQDLFVGYDSRRIGQTMGQFLAEEVYEGDYIILSGDKNDNNATLLYDGAMRYIKEIKKDIHVLLDEPVPGWDPLVAKEMVKKAIIKNGNKIDAIMAPNDKIAGACVEALEELGITTPVAITGMDAEIDAVQRIVAGTQSMTIYMDLRELANTAIDQAYNLAIGEPIDVNAEFDNQSSNPIEANLITGKIVTKQNLDKILIDSGQFTRKEVYGK